MPGFGLVALEAPLSGMALIIASMKDAFTLVGTIITAITTQPVLLFLLAAGLIPVGIMIFRQLRHSVN